MDERTSHTPNAAGAAFELAAVTPPRWRICATCGHAWRSRSRGVRFRCARCEQAARSTALAAAAAIRERT